MSQNLAKISNMSNYNFKKITVVPPSKVCYLFPFVDNDIKILITINQYVKRFDSIGEENRKIMIIIMLHVQYMYFLFL